MADKLVEAKRSQGQLENALSSALPESSGSFKQRSIMVDHRCFSGWLYMGKDGKVEGKKRWCVINNTALFVYKQVGAALDIDHSSYV